jgi:hypothetical protein
MSVIELNRLNIIGTLDLDTPKVVIDEIARSHGTTSNNVVDASDHLVLSVRPPYKKGHLRAIARYVNPSCVWSQKTLLQSFDFIQQFNESRCVVPTEMPYVGPQTPEHTHSYNACMLYKLHKAWNLRTYHDTTLDEMALAVKLYLSDQEDIIEDIVSSLRTVNKKQLISMMVHQERSYASVDSDIEIYDEDPEEDHDLSLAAINNITESLTKDTLLKRINPKTASEAVVLGAINYQLDLSHCQQPTREYRRYLKTNAYTPQDELMLNRFIYNPHVFDLTRYFNPFLPEHLYNKYDLETLVALEGVTPTQLQETDLSKYDYLQMVSFKVNVYHGLQINIQSTQTMVYKYDLAEVEPSSILCLGTFHEVEPLTYDELAEYWDNVKEYLHPSTNEILPRSVINKLLAIHKHCWKFNFTRRSLAKLKHLVAVIHKIESEKVVKSKQVDHFYAQYQSLNKTIQARIRKCIHKLFLLSMTMRGWKNEESYPIEKAPICNQIEIDVNVTEAFNDLIQTCATLGKHEHIIMDLPLFLYYNGEFRTTDDPEQGILLQDRLKIIADGRSVYGCIRTSSNWLATSAHRYMVLLRMAPPFDIERLTRIG